MATLSTGLNVKITAQDSASKVVKNLQSTVIRFVGAVSAAVAAISAIGLPVASAKDFDKAMTGVAKTTGFTKTQIDELAKSLDDMSRRIAVSQVELAGIAEVAGQLGLNTEGVAGVEAFTESVARASVTLGITSDQLGAFGAQVLNVFNLDSSQLENVFSAVNELSNNSVADAKALLDIMLRMGDIAGNSVTQVAALAAWFKDLGVATEVAGTSGVRFFSNMESKAADFAKLMNITQREWINLVKVDAVDAFKKAATALGQLDAVTKTTLAKKLLGEGRQLALANKAINASVGGFENLNRLLDLSSKSFQDGASSIEEYSRVSQSFANKWQVFQNVLQSIAISIGNTLLPVLSDVIQEMETLLTSPQGERFFSELGDSIQSVVQSFAGFVTSLTSSGEALENFSAAVSAIGIAGFALSIRKIGTEFGSYLIPKLTKATTKLGKVSRATYGAQNSFVKMAGATAIAAKGITGLLSRLLGLVTGPIGVIATTLLIFSDEIFEVIGTLFGTREGAALERQFALMEEKARQEAKKAITSYTEYVNKEFSNINVAGTFQGLGDTASFDDYVEDSAKALSALAEAMKATRDGVEFTFQQDKAITAFTVQIENAREEIVRLGEDTAEIQKGNRFFGNQDITDRDANTQRLRQNEERVRELKKIIETSKGYLDTLVNAQEAATKTQGKILGRASTLANQLAATTGESFARWIEAYAKVRRIQDEVTAGEKDLAEAEKVLEEEEVGTDRWEELRIAVVAVEGPLVAARASLASVKKEAADLENVAGFDIDKVVSVKADTTQAVQDLAKSFIELNDAGKLLNFEDQAQATTSLLLKHTQLKAVNEKLLGSFSNLKDPIISVVKTFRGVADNIQKTVNAIRNSTRTVQAEIDEIFRSKGVEAESLIDFSKVDAATGKEMKRITDKYAKLYAAENARLQKVGRAGQTSATLEYLKGQEDQEIATTKATGEFAKGQIDAANAINKVNGLLEVVTGTLEEYQAAQATIDENRDANAYDNGAKGARQYSKDLSNMLLLQGKVTDGLKALDAAAIAAASAVPSLKEFATDGSLISVVPDLGAKEAVQNAKNEIDDLKQAVIAASIASKKPIEDTVNSLKKQITDLEAGLASTLAASDQMLKKLVEANPALKEVAVTMKNAWSDAFKDITGSYEEVKAAITQPFDVTGADLIDVEGIQAQLDGPLSKSAQDAGIRYAESFGAGLAEVLKSQLSAATIILGTDAAPPITLTNVNASAAAAKDLAQASAAGRFTNLIDITPDEAKTTSAIQGILDSKEYTIQVIPEVASPEGGGAAAPGFAGGGPVRGPGTGTSDSILSWLSNGEYVMDTRTTRLFGSGFFKQLQLIARSGGSLRNLGLPGFAGGGLVSSPLSSKMLDSLAAVQRNVALGVPAGGGSVVELVVNVGGDKFNSQMDSQIADRLVRTLRKNRGV